METYYAKQRSREHYRGCAIYVDLGELLDKAKDVTAVKVMTPDHTHAVISIAALKRGMNVIIPEARMRAYRSAHNLPEPAPRQRRGGRQGGDQSARNAA